MLLTKFTFSLQERLNRIVSAAIHARWHQLVHYCIYCTLFILLPMSFFNCHCFPFLTFSVYFCPLFSRLHSVSSRAHHPADVGGRNVFWCFHKISESSFNRHERDFCWRRTTKTRQSWGRKRRRWQRLSRQWYLIIARRWHGVTVVSRSSAIDVMDSPLPRARPITQIVIVLYLSTFMN